MTEPAVPASRIYISYRRQDAEAHVLPLYERLRKRFGKDRVVMNTASVGSLERRADLIERELASCPVLLVVIHPGWVATEDPETRGRLIDNPTDYLRLEVATALGNQDVLVLPVLVEGGSLPALEDLPDVLVPLAAREPVELREAHWESDVERLIRAVNHRLRWADAETEHQDGEDEGSLPESQSAEPFRSARAALDRAKKSLDQHRFHEAMHHADDALALIPESSEAAELRAHALELRAEVGATREREQRARELMRKAQQAVKDAKAMLDEGRHDVAIAILEQFSPSHELVSQALEEARQQFAEVERQRQQAERRRQLEEMRSRDEAERHRKREATRAQEAREEEERRRAEAKRREDDMRRLEEERDRSEPELKPSVGAPPVLRPPSAPAAPRRDAPGDSERPAPTAGSGAGGGGWIGMVGGLAGKIKDAITGMGKKETSTIPQRQADSAERPEPAPVVSDVLLGVSAPNEVSVGGTFIARFVAYVEEVAAEVKEQLRDLDERSTIAGMQVALGLTPTGGGRWRKGTPVTVRVSGKHLSAEPSTQSFTWNGRQNLLSFVLTVAPDAPKTGIQLRFEAFIEGVPVAFVPLTLRVGADVGRAEANIQTARPASTAFASYASQDAELVALCLSALQRWDPHLDVFIDCLDLTPNESWKHELERIIPTRDAFLLFWSVNAMKSEWVAWELDLAASMKGIDAVRPMPIDDPELAPPPDTLKHLHFRDRYMLARQGFLQLAKQRSDSSPR